MLQLWPAFPGTFISFILNLKVLTWSFQPWEWWLVLFCDLPNCVSFTGSLLFFLFPQKGHFQIWVDLPKLKAASQTQMHQDLLFEGMKYGWLGSCVWITEREGVGQVHRWCSKHIPGLVCLKFVRKISDTGTCDTVKGQAGFHGIISISDVCLSLASGHITHSRKVTAPDHLLSRPVLRL